MAQAKSNPILNSRLSNGLQVILQEDHSAPIASIWTWYRVGSRNELPGKTGISHWVEHMQFKGTASLEKGRIFRDVSRVGGTLNALTSHDWTAYFETVPSHEIELPLRIESDRMANSLFDPDEVESERSVILSERQGAENNPGYALYEDVVGAALRAHPYRHMVIGHESDLRQITRDDLFAHYRRFYHPANAFIVAVGDFESDYLLERLERSFGAISTGPLVPREINVTEPPQLGERRVLLRLPSGVPYLRMAFHAPEAANSDLIPLLVTEAVLSGGQPMGFGGGGAMGRSSRLYRALVASGIARAASSDTSITIDPYLFQIGVTGLPGSDLSVVERVLEDEIHRLHHELVPASELGRAVRQLEAQFVYSAEGVTNQAYWLGQWEIVDQWSRMHSMLNEISAVTAEDIQRIAQRYLQLERRTVGWIEPATASGAGTKSPVREEHQITHPMMWGLDGLRRSSKSLSATFHRHVLPNGMVILGQDRPNSRSIALRMRIPAGAIRELLEESGTAFLTARSLLRGFAGRSFEDISTRTDELGCSISIDAGRKFVEARIRGLRDDFPELVTLLAQAVQRPDFPVEEVEKLRAEQLGAIAEADNDTRATADRIMRRNLYPEPNPLGRRLLGEVSTIVGLHQDALRDFHSRTFGPNGTTITVVGGLGEFEQAIAHISDSFGSWTEGPRVDDPETLSVRNMSTVGATEVISGKSQADVAVGVATLARNHPDFYALDLGNLILGRLGLMGRLGAEVRDRQGLAYYAFSQLEARRDGGLWSARAGVDPTNVERALAAIESELFRIREELISDTELEDGKSYLVGILPLALETNDGVASTLLAIEEFELGLDYLDRYPDIIAEISRNDVLNAARQHLDPSQFAIGIARPPTEGEVSR